MCVVDTEFGTFAEWNAQFARHHGGRERVRRQWVRAAGDVLHPVEKEYSVSRQAVREGPQLGQGDQRQHQVRDH